MSLDFKPIIEFTESGEVSTAFMIESVKIEENVTITGWKVGDIRISLAKNNAQPNFNTFPRPDVISALGLSANADTFGFEIIYPKPHSAQSALIFEAGAAPGGKRHELTILHGETLPPAANNLSFPALETMASAIEKHESGKLIIVGSAPTLNSHLDYLKKFEGDIWALNDAWIYLEERGIKVHAAVATDSRFIKKRQNEIKKSLCRNLITIDAVDLTPIAEKQMHAFVMKSLGRDGFSREIGKVYHGCSVFFTALQTACSYSLSYDAIECCAILLSPPTSYRRIDGTSHMPEYVHAVQLKNAQRAMQEIRKFRINFTVLDAESNLNFL